MTSDRLTPDTVEKFSREDEKTSMSLENYILELALQDLDPDERLLEYLEVAKSLLDQAKEELGKGDIR